MNSNWIFLVYYIYALIVIGLFSYAVFWLDRSGFWFILAILLLNIAPEIKITNKNKNKSDENSI